MRSVSTGRACCEPKPDESTPSRAAVMGSSNVAFRYVPRNRSRGVVLAVAYPLERQQRWNRSRTQGRLAGLDEEREDVTVLLP